jgi:pathogenesis-related protein 1
MSGEWIYQDTQFQVNMPGLFSATAKQTTGDKTKFDLTDIVPENKTYPVKEEGSTLSVTPLTWPDGTVFALQMGLYLEFDNLMFPYLSYDFSPVFISTADGSGYYEDAFTHMAENQFEGFGDYQIQIMLMPPTTPTPTPTTPPPPLEVPDWLKNEQTIHLMDINLFSAPLTKSGDKLDFKYSFSEAHVVKNISLFILDGSSKDALKAKLLIEYKSQHEGETPSDGDILTLRALPDGRFKGMYDDSPIYLMPNYPLVSVVAGEKGSNGTKIGTLKETRFWALTDIAADWEGNIYATDGGNTQIFKVDFNHDNVTTVAGQQQTRGDQDGAADKALFNVPVSITLDADNLYVGDCYNEKIRRVEGFNTASPKVSTLAANSLDPLLLGLAIDKQTNNLYAGSRRHVYKLNLSDGTPTLWVSQTNESNPKILLEDDFTDVVADSHGNVYISARSGYIYKIDVAQDKQVDKVQLPTQAGEAVSLVMDGNDNIYVLTPQGDLHKLEAKNNLTYSGVVVPAGQLDVVQSGHKPTGHVEFAGMAIDRENNIYVSAYEAIYKVVLVPEIQDYADQIAHNIVPDKAPPEIPTPPDVPPPSPQDQIGSRLTADERDKVLAAHNQARDAEKAGIPPLQWDLGLAKKAQEWADYLAKNDLFEHRSLEDRKRSGTYMGENLYMNSAPIGDVTEPVTLWANEKTWYKYATIECKAPPDQACGHYTQVVWRNTTHVGCARATSKHGDYWVCNYSPGGNYKDQKPF